MIFVFGGFTILIISFAIALISLIREQKGQKGLEETAAQSKPVDDVVGQANIAVDKAVQPEPEKVPEKSEEEIKSAQREEAYRILQSRVNKMTESDSGSRPVVREPEVEVDPETNIEDKLEGDIALSQKVPLPWEEQVSVPRPDWPVKPQADTSAPVVTTPAEGKDTQPGDKLSGQINISDLDK